MPKKDDAPKEAVYRFRVKDAIEGGVASFVAGDEAVDLSPESPVFETSDKNLAAGLRGLWFLEEVSSGTH